MCELYNVLEAMYLIYLTSMFFYLVTKLYFFIQVDIEHVHLGEQCGPFYMQQRWWFFFFKGFSFSFFISLFLKYSLM